MRGNQSPEEKKYGRRTSPGKGYDCIPDTVNARKREYGRLQRKRGKRLKRGTKPKLF